MVQANASNGHDHDLPSSGITGELAHEQRTAEAKDVLRSALKDQRLNGTVSSRLLGTLLQEKGYIDSRELIAALKHVNDDTWKYYPNSFYTKDRYESVVAQEEAENEAIEELAQPTTQSDDERRPNSREERRLTRYVRETLLRIYDSEHMPEETTFVFDVQSQHPGGKLENPDVIAVHWRSPRHIEVVTVEVKLKLEPTAIHQAMNYRRFSHRVWVACVVEWKMAEDTTECLARMDATQRSLFDYAVDNGIGVLAARHKQGLSYSVCPIHWPQVNTPSTVEAEAFLERYRLNFEAARVLPPPNSLAYPKLV